MSKAIVGASLAAFLAVAAMLPAAAQVSSTSAGMTSGASATVAGTVTTTPQQFVVRVQNQEVALLNEPLRSGADILVPLRESLAALGAQDIRYLPAARQITFMLRGQQGMINLQTQQASLGNTPISIPGPLRMVNGTYYVRSEFLASLDPTFTVTRVQVAGFRGGPGFPTPASVNSFTFGGNTYDWNAPTYYEGGVLMVPLADTLNSLGIGPFPYQPGDLQVTFPYNGQNVLLNMSSGYAYVGDQQWILDRPVVVLQDRVYVPASFIARLVPGFGVAGAMRLPATVSTGITSTTEAFPETGTAGMGLGK